MMFYVADQLKSPKVRGGSLGTYLGIHKFTPEDVVFLLTPPFEIPYDGIVHKHFALAMWNGQIGLVFYPELGDVL